MDEFSRVERVVGALAQAEAVGDAAQLVVDNRQQPVQHRLVGRRTVPAEGGEQFGQGGGVAGSGGGDQLCALRGTCNTGAGWQFHARSRAGVSWAITSGGSSEVRPLVRSATS